MMGAGGKITAGACVGALALTSATSWAATPHAREVVSEAVTTGTRAANVQRWSGWTREGSILTRDGWTVRAEAIERTATGWVARGDARLVGPDDLYVRAPRVELDAVRAHGHSDDGAKAALVGSGWTLEGARVEVDLERASARIIEMGSRDEVTR